MKNCLLILVFYSLSFGAFSQANSSIAVANPNVEGLYATPEMCAKIIRLEMAKLNKYSVYDVFDMQEVYDSNASYKKCLSKTCLVDFGQKLGVDYMITGSFDLLSNKIVITLKIIDVSNNTVYKSGLKEFTNQEKELQRMVEVLLKEMLDVPLEKELVDRLKFDNDIITKANIGKVSNSGPRVGVGVLTGSFYEFANRPEAQGGLDIFPAVSMLGYQLEAQYVGTDNFSALAEFIFNVSGLEQGIFLPTLSILNGFRFGNAGWEFAFGPGFTLSRTSTGFFDSGNDDGGFYGEKNGYISYSDWLNDYVNQQGYGMNDYEAYGYAMGNHMDVRGDVKLSTMFLMAFGRTFRAGALNIPVNIFYSSRKGGGIAGINVGFNVTKKKTVLTQGL
jgi:hypothetical protein